MKKQLTRRQHFVPRFYLAQWDNSNHEVVQHDLADDTMVHKSAKNILWEEYYYEEDPSAPDNRVEEILGKIETDAAVVFEKIRSFNDADPMKIEQRLKSGLTKHEIKIIRRFAAFQYFRVPGAIEHKRFELQPSEISEAVKEMALNPGRFVESGVAYLEKSFQRLSVLLLVSNGQDYITSDWPCFDAADSDEAPLLGEDLGSKAGVVAYLPISTRVAALFFSKEYSVLSPQVSKEAITRVQTDGEVRNQNALVIQKAERFVVASRESPFIFKVASKRKKGRPKKT
jgi:hypothetical protein